MTLKQTITQELLHSVDDPAGLEELFQRKKHSKGSLFPGFSRGDDPA